jgi:hypothetical protein
MLTVILSPPGPSAYLIDWLPMFAFSSQVSYNADSIFITYNSLCPSDASTTGIGLLALPKHAVYMGIVNFYYAIYTSAELQAAVAADSAGADSAAEGGGADVGPCSQLQPVLPQGPDDILRGTAYFVCEVSVLYDSVTWRDCMFNNVSCYRLQPMQLSPPAGVHRRHCLFWCAVSVQPTCAFWLAGTSCAVSWAWLWGPADKQDASAYHVYIDFRSLPPPCASLTVCNALSAAAAAVVLAATPTHHQRRTQHAQNNPSSPTRHSHTMEVGRARVPY